VFVEVVAELALGYEHGIEQLLELWVANIVSESASLMLKYTGTGPWCQSELSSSRLTTNAMLTKCVIFMSYMSIVSPLVGEPPPILWLRNALAG
jgi:hypothetical protein